MHYRRRMVQSRCQNGSMVVWPPQAGDPVRLAGTARRVWELAEYPVTLAEMAGALAVEYAADEEEIARETGPFLESLCARGLLETREVFPTPEERQRQRYLSLLKRSLVNLLYPEHEMRIQWLRKSGDGLAGRERERFLRDIRYREPVLYQDLVDAKQSLGISPKAKYCFSHTMVGLQELENLERCAEAVFAERVPGDFLEAGVCQGGAAIFLRALQVAYGEGNRRLWAADSFEGLPPPRSGPDRDAGLDLSEGNFPSIAFGLEGVRDNFQRYGLLDANVAFLPGWFAETLPSAPVDRLAVLRVDADLYASTREVLESLYPRVSPGGFVVVDDYGLLEPCRRAVDEYRARHGIVEPLEFVSRSCVFWRRAA